MEKCKLFYKYFPLLELISLKYTMPRRKLKSLD